jgi:hypothetical protein
LGVKRKKSADLLNTTTKNYDPIGEI